ncbi:hypothetical protein JOB18_014765 [Solea senegalensis]|uniref:L1 transposable element RRM domain-containing protein n=1 Tax=Solea senegalensis TaxID=28829 RepID=A0AAV6PR47_SOLSE|nr:hypothetical protein JOB18_014765 [Solea senegalensis]
MAAAAAPELPGPGGGGAGSGGNSDPVPLMDLEALFCKQRDSFKANMAILIQQSTESLMQSVDSLGQQVTSFNHRLTNTEVVVSENFVKITEMEAVVKTLQSQATVLLEHVNDLENRSRRSNLQIINIPERSEKDQDPTKFVSNLLMEVTGPDVFNNPPEIERAHRSLGPRPGDAGAGKPRALIVKFLRFQEKETVLRWARQHKMDYRGSELRVYPDISAALAKNRAAFNAIKHSLYLKGIKFRLLQPACLQVSFHNENLYFDSP